MNRKELEALLNQKYEAYNRPAFIENDPVSIPHLFSEKQDIEIMGFFAATLAWGQRKTIIANCYRLIDLMDGQPYRFITGHEEKDLKRFNGFIHRTFNDTDLLYLVSFFREYYSTHTTLEDAFADGLLPGDTTTEHALNHFKKVVFSNPLHPPRTAKHVSSPAQKSACKRLNMFLRWMVRKDDRGVDFGIWERIGTRQLVCPLDVHVQRVARFLGLIQREQSDWQAALELTGNLKKFDADDPVKYDYALFGMGVEEKLGKMKL